MRVTFIVNTLLFSGKEGRSNYFVKFLTTNFGLGRVPTDTDYSLYFSVCL